MATEFAAELERRRAQVRERLGSDVLVLFSAPVFVRNNDVEHPYRQHSDFFYLTGFEEPESALVLSNREPFFTLFVRPKDKEREIWDGRRAGTEGAVRDFGAGAAFAISELESKLADLCAGSHRIHYAFGEHSPWDDTIFGVVSALRRRRKQRIRAPYELVDAGALLHELRLEKSPFELGRMRAAAALSAAAHRRAMQAARPGMTEFELAAELEYVFRKGGSRRDAYESIVGSGPNGTILHYRENSRVMNAGELVLIDAGAEVDHYASDITRTFPVDGKFTPAARALYEVALLAQEAAFGECRPGRTVEDVHESARRVIEDGLVRLGLVRGDADERAKGAARFFMHRTSHYLGMDVHDVGLYVENGEVLPLRAGMVITVEPGIYVAEDDETVPAEYRGIGIRIEDDVVIQDGEPEILTNAVPRAIDEIEALCASKPSQHEA